MRTGFANPTTGERMPGGQPLIAYPRRRISRSALRFAGRLLLPLLSRTVVVGRENIPSEGPLIVVGNHVAAMEVVLMVLVVDRQIEFLGTADIPPPPLMDAITRIYGFIPVFRGKMERKAMQLALSVLRQGGVLGVFPEGGIWRRGERRARKGVAWLSHRSGAPVLPMGFGGMEGALARMSRLQRPRFDVRVGEPLAPIVLESGRPRSEALDEAAQSLLAKVIDLLPPEDRPHASDVVEEVFSLEVTATTPTGQEMMIPDHLRPGHGAALSRLLHHPAITRVFLDRLHLPAEVFLHIEEKQDPRVIAKAARAVLSYLEQNNAYFLTYRFGGREGGSMAEGLSELLELADWAARARYRLSVTPVRRYRRVACREWMEQRTVGEAHDW
jgi:1-acyl-sn-glycerol-3-phosphate acyltransferase